MSTPVCLCGHRRHHGRPSPSWRPGVSVALITGYFRRHHGRLPIPREHHVEPESKAPPYLFSSVAPRTTNSAASATCRVHQEQQGHSSGQGNAVTPTALRHVGAVRGKPVALPAQTPDRGAAHDAQGLLLRRVEKGNDILCVLGPLRSQQCKRQ